MYDIIINPASRSGKGRSLWDQTIKPYLDEKQVEYTPFFSEKKGDVTALVQKLTASTNGQTQKKLIILGGDGTFDEALQGIQNFSGAVIGYIPTGSSNDFARDLRIPRDPIQALERILHTGSTHSMDIGTVTLADGSIRRFAVSCGIGFDAAVCEEANRSRIKERLNRIGLGKLAYLGVALKQLFSAKSVSCRLSLNGEEITIRKFLFVACMIHKYEGGGFMFAPNADSSDGLLDLCAVGSIPKLLILFALPTAFFGKHYIFRGIDAYQADSVRIRTTSPLWLHTDGEVPDRYDDIMVTCQKGVLNIIY